MKTIKILILEDDLKTLSLLTEKLFNLEENYYTGKNAYDFAVTVFSDYKSVENIVNKIERPDYDIVLLDRDCKLGGSFHILDLEKIPPERIISISSIPDYNEEARKRGVTRIVLKEYERLNEFGDKVIGEIKDILENLLIK